MGNAVIAVCGLDCAACPAFHASERLSMDERQKVADQWSKEYHFDFKAADIDCVGCSIKEGVHVGNCAVCEMRLCALGRGFTTCAECAEFSCAKLDKFLAMVPQARTNLVALRGG